MQNEFCAALKNVSAEATESIRQTPPWKHRQTPWGGVVKLWGEEKGGALLQERRGDREHQTDTSSEIC
jgi:hypothetical protein